MTDTSQQPNAVALIKTSPQGLRATGAFTKFDVPFTGTAAVDTLVQVRLGDVATTVHEFGPKTSVPAVIAALAQHNGQLAFTADQEADARRAAAQAINNHGRRDLRKLTTFTIDGEHTRDFDDALSARHEGDSIRVWVHVADVAAYVHPGSALDIEARRRATSVYLPTLTVPMLPRALSTGACSLVENEDRAAVTAEFLLTDGVVVEKSFYRSTIRSDARLTYGHVEDIFLGRAEPGPTYAAALAAARQAAVDRYHESGENRGEEEFVFTDGEVTGFTVRPEEESQKLIERLMVLANQEVAQFLSDRHVPTLYRVHAGSDPDRVARLVNRLRSLGVRVEHATYDGAAEAISDHERKHGPNPALLGLLHGSRPPASYTRELSAHAGMGIPAYTHFTSPIRRYADLIVHRTLLAEIGAEEHTTAPVYGQLPALAVHLNERTRAAKKLDRRARDICRASLLNYRLRTDQLQRNLTGLITGMSFTGCFVQVDCTEGMLHGRALGGDVNEHQTVWRRPNSTLRLGSTIAVRVRAVDLVRGQLKLELRPAPKPTTKGKNQ